MRQKKLPGIQQISFVHDVGETVTEVTCSGARIGFVIAQDKTVESAITDCCAALDCIKVVIE